MATKRVARCLLIGVMAMSAGMARAQSPGEAVYKAKCLSCHGAAGMAGAGVGKAMKVKPVTHPDVAKMPEDKMVDAVRNGMGKMQAYKGKLTDAQIRDSVAYFRTFLK